ncbi:VOC family protein [Novipirellula caenicola]|uniref:VOC domain-containing protein n=1 Tax=Novipirellula caenicola TaxID=1536901 RepID=A0ABP9VS90_9BACT
MLFGELGEIILYVQNMDAQFEFYHSLLGFPVVYQDNESVQACSWILLDTGACKLALHSGGQRCLGKDAPKIVFFVHDLKCAYDKLRENGVDVCDIFSPAPNTFVANTFDPEGNSVSFESTTPLDS